METITAVRALGALAHESRLAIFRLLVVAGPDGVPAGTLAEQVGVAPSALSFHLKDLAHAELVVPRQDGRRIFYSARFDTMNALLGFMTDNCCQGAACAATAPNPTVCCPEVS